MLNRIRNFFAAAGAIACVVFYAWVRGKQKGRDDEKIKNDLAVRENVVRAMRARGMLYDSDFVRRLHDRYCRG